MADKRTELVDRLKTIKANRDLQKAPKCPNCQKPMETLFYEQAGSIIFSVESGSYVDSGQTTEAVRCGNCGKVIGVWRADGTSWGFMPEYE